MSYTFIVKKFIKNVENFVCENCGYKVVGNGYTNHCPKCLFSKHVDINPGDRQERCGGLMEPVSFELKNGAYSITHKCLKCKHTKKNHLSEGDSFEILINMAKNKK